MKFSTKNNNNNNKLYKQPTASTNNKKFKYTCNMYTPHTSTYVSTNVHKYDCYFSFIFFFYNNSRWSFIEKKNWVSRWTHQYIEFSTEVYYQRTHTNEHCIFITNTMLLLAIHLHAEKCIWFDKEQDPWNFVDVEWFLRLQEYILESLVFHLFKLRFFLWVSQVHISVSLLPLAFPRFIFYCIWLSYLT